MIKDFIIENRINPIGLDETPRFSWKLTSDKQDVVQQSYQIQVICGGKMVWDSGKVESDQSIYVNYNGDALTPMTKYKVQVSVWDNYGEMGQEMGTFETGLMGQPWQAKWITHTMPEEEKACPVFHKAFQCDKTIKCARLYVTAHGVYEALLNGKPVSDAFMAPGWTSYHNRVQYQTYDITELVQEKLESKPSNVESTSAKEDKGCKNEITITVGNGWYKGSLGFEERPNIYGDRVALLAMVCLEYEDGTTECIGTGEDWTVSDGVIRDSEIYHGEIQDFLVPHKEYGSAVLLEADKCQEKVIAQVSEPVRITKRFPVKEKIITPKGEIVFDFGQNMAGLVEIRLPKLSGDKLVVKHAETLDKEGNFYMENLRTAKCTDTYIYGEEQVGMAVLPHFTFHGFRYICVEGVDEAVDAECFTACAMHTDMRKTGSFCTDNELVNQLVSNIEWGQRGNFLDVPTDCPQRNERLGWTGDAQVFSATASYHFDTALFFKKWLADMALETNMQWGVPHVVPNILGDQDGAAAWSDAATIIPWNLYRIYGDKKQLEESYPMMQMWVDYIRTKAGENGLWQTGFQYGDWLALDIESGSTDRTGGTDKYLVANAYYAYSTRIVRDAAAVLGYDDKAKEYDELYEQIIKAINQEFVTSTGRLVCETQTACVLMLYFDLAKPEYRDRIKKTLEQNINVHRNHLTTGFVGTPYLCHCLSEIGLHDLAGEIFRKEDFPGWFYAVKKGATTIWERWNSVLPNGDFDESGMNSLNHYAYGSIGSWLYEKAAGITTLKPGYKKISIRPILTKGMTEVSAEYESVYGTVKSAWVCRDGKISVDITIPANTTACVRLPEKEEEITVGSGTYHYEYETETDLTVGKFSLDSTLGELLAEDLAVQMFNQLAPGMLDNPMIKFAYEMTIADLGAMAEEAKPLYQAVIDALNAQ